MQKLKLVFLSIATMLIMSQCNNESQNQSNNGPQKEDILRANVDTTVDPAKDFFAYANGGWIKRNPIPETESGWGIGNLVNEEINARLRKLSEDATMVKNAAKGSPTQIIGDFYASGMDSVAIEGQGANAINQELREINNIKDVEGVMTMVAKLQVEQVAPLFGIYVWQDEKNSEVIALHLTQGGLGMPNRDYYFNDDDRTKKVRNEYTKYVEKTFQLLGDDAPTAKKNSDAVMKLETSLAATSRKLEDLRDPYKNYNKKSIQDLSKLCASVQWETFFSQIGATKLDSVIVGQPEFFTTVDKNLKSTSIDVWKNYLRMQLVASFSDKLGGNFEKVHFHFYYTVLRGQQKQKPRWKRVVDDENNLIGELLGQLFVKEYFSPETKKRYTDLVSSIMVSYEEHIQNLDWMSDTTKQKAISKLHKITPKVGYPDKWKDMSGMDISQQPYVRNCINANIWWWNYQMNKLGKPVDRSEWDMTPQTYNAYYNPSNNEIVLPAAIFAIAGTKDADLDDAIIFGYAGASTIGHELTHGFDDEGRQFDEKGNLRDWWTKDDADKFIAKTKLYVEQFNNYVVLDSLHVNGEATLGENIADLGGIALGLDAFKKTEQYKKGEKIGGFTPLQRYFLGYALGWLGHQRDERLASQILTDVHAPINLRVNGPFANIPEFYEAFGIKDGTEMWRAEDLRVKIW